MSRVSLTDAVKLAATSLTDAVKAAGQETTDGSVTGPQQQALDNEYQVTRNNVRVLRERLAAAGVRFAAIAMVSMLLSFAGPSIIDADPPVRATSQKRVALVIGNSAYQRTPSLTNPKNDAADMGAALRGLGFQVIDGFDLDKAAFDRRIRDFAIALQGADVGVFFYAGHGLQVAGQNYLVPVDAQLTSASALDFEMVRLDLVHRTMEREAQTNILFFDACRNNPLARNLARSMGTRSTEIGRGFAAVESGVGTLISFSTQPGNVALDGAGRNSPFAGALVKHLSNSNDDLSAVLISVRNDVIRETQKKQVPWEHSALTDRFYFSKGSPMTLSEPKFTEAERAWAAAQGTKSIAVLETLIVRLKDRDPFYAELARERIEELKKQQVTIATPSVARPTNPRAEDGLVSEIIDQTLGNVPSTPAKPAEAAAMPAR